MNTKSIPPGGPFGPLSLHINAYLTQVKEQGYAHGSICEQVCALRMFGRWLKRTDRELCDLNEAVSDEFLRHAIKRRYPKNAARSTLRRLLAMLRRIGVIPAAKAERPSPSEQLMCAYLRQDRPRCSCRRVFIRDHAPIGGFHRAVAISNIVRRALARAGVVSARKGAHLLRHSLATEMLRKGASLDDIGEVLRHKSPDSTAIYAKVDLKSLRTLALPWPGGAR